MTVASDLVILDYDMPRNLFSATCVHTLYDSGCRAIRGRLRARTGRPEPGSTSSTILSGVAAASHAQGSLVWTSGANANVRATVKSVAAGSAFHLIYPLPFSPSAGDAFTVYAGCDHTPRDLPWTFQQRRELSRLPLRAAAATGLLTAARPEGVQALRSRSLINSNPHPSPSATLFPAEAGEASARAAVVAAARSWIGTPYHHAADVKGRQGGVDCAMLLVRVYCDLGLVEPFDPRPYTRDWMLHRDEERYLGFLLARAKRFGRPGPAT